MSLSKALFKFLRNSLGRMLSRAVKARAEAIRLEAARLEAARLEAARLEAAQKEAARQADADFEEGIRTITTVRNAHEGLPVSSYVLRKRFSNNPALHQLLDPRFDLKALVQENRTLVICVGSFTRGASSAWAACYVGYVMDLSDYLDETYSPSLQLKVLQEELKALKTRFSLDAYYGEDMTEIDSLLEAKRVEVNNKEAECKAEAEEAERIRLWIDELCANANAN
jgi:hypothetical protein